MSTIFNITNNIHIWFHRIGRTTYQRALLCHARITHETNVIHHMQHLSTRLSHGGSYASSRIRSWGGAGRGGAGRHTRLTEAKVINTATPLFVTGMTQNTSSITCSKAFVHQLIDGIRLQDLASAIVNSVPTGQSVRVSRHRR